MLIHVSTTLNCFERPIILLMGFLKEIQILNKICQKLWYQIQIQSNISVKTFGLHHFLVYNEGIPLFTTFSISILSIEILRLRYHRHNVLTRNNHNSYVKFRQQ